MTDRVESSAVLRAPAGRPRRLGLALLMLAFGVSACTTVGPDYHRPRIDLPSTWHTDSSALADAPDVLDGRWWQGFADPALDSLIDEALRSNRDIRVAAARVDEFSARLDASRSADKPQVGYNVGGSRIRRSEEQPNKVSPTAQPSYNDFSTGLTVQWEIDLWGRVRRANEASLADLMSVQALRRGVALSVASGVATGYVQLLALDKEAAVVQQTLANRQAALDLVALKQRGGSASLVDVGKARAEVEQVRALVPDVQRRVAIAESALSVLLGRHPGPVQRGEIDKLKMPPVPQGLPSDLLSRRPDIQAAEQSLVAANARIGVAKAEFFPTISLTGALGLASDDLRWLLAKTARTGELTRGLVGTLFSAGRIESGMQQAQAVREQMAEQFAQAVLSGLQEVEEALISRVKTGEQEAALQRRQDALDEVTQLTRARQEGGQSTVLEVLEAERQATQAGGERAQSRRDQFLALVNIYKAMGGGWALEPVDERARTASLGDAAGAPASRPQP